MSIQSITNTASTYAASNSSSTGKSKNATSSEATSNSDIAVVYEKSNVSKSSYKTDTKLVAQMKQAAEQRSNQLRDLVQNMLTKQGTKNVQSLDIYQALRTGKVSVDPTTAAQAAKDISENGYWGVEQTSDRLVSFAKALSGGDPDKADTMINAVKKGFEQATKAWGDELPDICQKTLDATMKKLDAWKNGTEE